MNIFRKCLKKQFGKSKYVMYVKMCEEEVEKSTISKTKLEDKKIFVDMYEQLKQENEEYIKEKIEILTETLKHSLRVGMGFSGIFVFYILADIFLIALQLDHIITCAALLLMGICFIYKLLEFLANKYCFVDAYLIMIYKSVLEKLYKKDMNAFKMK